MKLMYVNYTSIKISYKISKKWLPIDNKVQTILHHIHTCAHTHDLSLFKVLDIIDLLFSSSLLVFYLLQL